MSIDRAAEQIQHLVGLRDLRRFSVTRVTPLILTELSGDEVLAEGDPDFTVGAWVQQYRRTYTIEKGQVVLVSHEQDGWTATELEHDGALHDFAPAAPRVVTGSRGGGSALTSLLAALGAAGIITDETTA